MNTNELAKARRARHLFFEDGKSPEGLLDRAISDSWVRCHAAGLASDAAQDFDPSATWRLNELKERHRNLIALATPVMELVFEQLRNSQRMIVLSDATGVILRTLGDNDFLARAQKLAVLPGVSWAEDHKGTNAIGTALINQAPVTVNGPQHYIAANAFLTCSAAPIYGPFGEIVGVLDITGDHRNYQPDMLAMARLSALMIENHLLRGCVPPGSYLRPRTDQAIQSIRGSVPPALRVHHDKHKFDGVVADNHSDTSMASASLETLETNAIKQAIVTHKGNISAAAKQLGISRNTLYRKMKRF